MAHYTSPESVELRVIYCYMCDGHYVAPYSGGCTSLVVHPANICCHHEDTKITHEQLKAAREVLGIQELKGNQL